MYLEIFRVWVSNLIFNQCKFDADYNKKIGKWLDENKELVVDNCTSTINGLKIWTGNYPYSYGHPWDPNGPISNGKEFGLSATNIVKLDMKVRAIKQKREKAKRRLEKKALMTELEDLS